MRTVTQWVKTPKGLGYIIDIKLDKVKVQLTDSSGFILWNKQPDWFEQNEIENITSPIKPDHIGYWW